MRGSISRGEREGKVERSCRKSPERQLVYIRKLCGLGSTTARLRHTWTAFARYFIKALSEDTTVYLLFPRPGGRAQAWQQCFSGWFLQQLPQKPLVFLLTVWPCAQHCGSSKSEFLGGATWKSEAFNNVPG